MTTVSRAGAPGGRGASYDSRTSPTAPSPPPPSSARGAPPGDARALAAAREALAILFGPAERRRFAVRLWDGSVDGPARDAARFTLVVRHAAALRRAFLPPSELALVEAYLHDDLDVEGDLEAAGTLGDDAAAALRSPRAAARLARVLLSLPRVGDRVDDDGRGPAPVGGGVRRHTRRRDAATPPRCATTTTSATTSTRSGSTGA